jgi:prepilin-type N-terminal cleavage/methylation domain-containing protein
MTPTSPSRPLRECGGFTLIEVMVSALLLGVVVTGATSLIATGRNLESAGSLRSQALRLAANSMERATHHFSAYPITTAPQGIPSNPILTTESGGNCTANQIDSIYAPELANWTDADGGNQVDVPYQRICVKLFWACGGPADSVVFRKRIANVQ